jgi:hypothetical protein
MTKEIEEELVYADWGYIPPRDLTQDEIDKVKKMIVHLNSTGNMLVMCAKSEEEIYFSEDDREILSENH